MNAKRKRGLRTRQILKSSVFKRAINNNTKLSVIKRKLRGGNLFIEDENFPKCRDCNKSNAFEGNVKDERSKRNGGFYWVNAPKKKKNLSEANENNARTRNKHRKEPLPMKMRAFPQSFWQQPNKTPCVSPGNVYCVPPPLSKEENSSENRETLEEVQSRGSQEIVSEPNIDLLFSLFRNVEEEQRKALGHEAVPMIRRGRPKKSKAELKVIRDDDPYLTSSAAESFLPLLSVRNSSESLESKIAKDEQILAMISTDGSSSTPLSSVTPSHHNYSQILSELVVQL